MISHALLVNESAGNTALGANRTCDYACVGWPSQDSTSKERVWLQPQNKATPQGSQKRGYIAIFSATPITAEQPSPTTLRAPSTVRQNKHHILYPTDSDKPAAFRLSIRYSHFCLYELDRSATTIIHSHRAEFRKLISRVYMVHTNDKVPSDSSL